jgi:hypothetical protein
MACACFIDEWLSKWKCMVTLLYGWLKKHAKQGLRRLVITQETGKHVTNVDGSRNRHRSCFSHGNDQETTMLRFPLPLHQETGIGPDIVCFKWLFFSFVLSRWYRKLVKIRYINMCEIDGINGCESIILLGNVYIFVFMETEIDLKEMC